MRRAVVVSAFVVVVGALAGGFYLVGPPAGARAQRLDARRETDLQGLRLAVDLYWTRDGRLPESLDVLTHEAGPQIESRDPETGERYGYTVKAADRYELCAAFARDSEVRSDFWSHGAGRRCFQVTAKPIRP
jgi:hypothetical protein